MARTGRAARITTPADRRRLPLKPTPWWRPIEPGLRLGYRHATGRRGTWWACLALPSGRQRKTTLGAADDEQPADGRAFLSFAEAQAKAVAWARAITTGEDRIQSHTVRDALVAYREQKDHAGQFARAGEVTTLLERHVPTAFLDTPIARLTPPMLRVWVGSLRNRRREHRGNETRLTQDRVDGLRGVMRAALRAAEADPELVRKGLNAETTAAATGTAREAPIARRQVLERSQIAALLAACGSVDSDLRLLCEVLDVSGARPWCPARTRVALAASRGTPFRSRRPSICWRDSPRIQSRAAWYCTGRSANRTALACGGSPGARLGPKTPGHGPSVTLCGRQDCRPARRSMHSGTRAPWQC
jgi:hypothetical protein